MGLTYFSSQLSRQFLPLSLLPIVLDPLLRLLDLTLPESSRSILDQLPFLALRPKRHLQAAQEPERDRIHECEAFPEEPVTPFVASIGRCDGLESTDESAPCGDIFCAIGGGEVLELGAKLSLARSPKKCCRSRVRYGLMMFDSYRFSRMVSRNCRKI